MAAPRQMSPKARILALLKAVPAGRVATFDRLAEDAAVPVRLVQTVLAQLTDDERQALAWHRVVAKGGAIGWHPHRDAQFAKLVREGISVSPAGIVQDMARVAVSDFAAPQKADAPAPPRLGRSRGMKDRPG